MAQYRKKPVVIEAWQRNGEQADAEGATSPMEPVSAGGLYSGEVASTFEPIGDAAARVVKSLTKEQAEDLTKRAT